MEKLKPKILLATMEFPPFKGGVGNYYYDLIKNLTDFETNVLLDGSTAIYHLDNLKIKRQKFLYRYFWPKWLKLFWLMLWEILTGDYQLIWVGHLLPIGTCAFLIKKIFNTPYVVSLHGLDIKRALQDKRKRFLTLKILQNASLVTTNSEYTLNEFKKTGLKTPTVVIYPCGHVLASQNPVATTAEINTLKAKLDIADKKIILTVGRLTERKGQDMVIMALPEVIQAKLDVVYLLIGRGSEKERLKELAKQFDVENRVIFLSNIDDEDLPLYYKTSDLFITTSRIIKEDDVEGFGMVYLEANSFGLPVIAAPTGGVAEAVIDNLNGLMCDPLNPQDIAVKIITLLSDKNLAAKLGELGRERVEKNFQIIDQANKLSNELAKII